ncbi:anion-transporting ATPase-like domain-containing protein, partial [Tribonema minus]
QILRNPPPGIDELVALAGVLRLARSKEYEFDRIVIDTAPTGHTLRLLSFPDFLDQFLDKVIKLRERLDGVLGVVAGLFGKRDNLVQQADVAVQTLIKYREEIIALRDLFADADATEFCVVTIPTQLAIAE